MSALLLAVGDDALAASLERWLTAEGHGAFRIPRSLAILAEAGRMAWDAALVDDSDLGRDALVVLAGVGSNSPIIGLGLRDLRLLLSLPLPLDSASLAGTLTELKQHGRMAMQLLPERRLAQANGREVALTRSEYRLLEVLMARRPAVVPIAEAMQAIWGISQGTGTPAPLRSHIRNLRSKLAQIGHAESLRSRRGKGYALTL